MTEKETEKEAAKEIFAIRTDDRGIKTLTRNGEGWMYPSRPAIQFWDQLQEARKELEELKAFRAATQPAITEGLRITLGRAILAKNELRAKLDAAESELGDVAAESDRLKEENAAYEKKLATLCQFLCEPGKSRPLSLGFEVGSAIRYIEDLEREVFALRQREREQIQKPAEPTEQKEKKAANQLLKVDRDDFLNLLVSHGVRWRLEAPENSHSSPLEIRFF